MRHRIEFSDNLAALAAIPSGSVPLIYVDPPFNTGKQQRRTTVQTTAVDVGDRTGFAGRQYRTTIVGTQAYADAFDDYLAFLAPRLREAHRVLKPNGTLYVHLDAREVHYVKVLLDEIFGRASFLNEIIWAYDYGGRPRDRWPAKHDNILVYVKNPKDYVFNSDEVEREPYMAPGLVTPEKAARGKLPSDCYSEDTDILTDRGWIPFADLTMDDRVATVSPEGRLLYASPTQIHAHRYQGPMCFFKSVPIDLLVTPNHRMYVRPKRNAPFAFVSASNVAADRRGGSNSVRYGLMTQLEWKGEECPLQYQVPACTYIRANHAKPSPPFDIGDWCEFMGFYLAQGSTYIYGTRHLVDLVEPKAAGGVEAVHALLRRMGIRYRYYPKRQAFNFISKQLVLYLRQFGYAYQRFIPRELLRLPPTHLQRLYRALMMGDGCVKPHQEMYYTASKQLADDVQELLIKLGYSASIIINNTADSGTNRRTGYAVNRRTSREFTISPHLHASTVDYDGMVYCCTVEPHHTLVVRRNGKPAVCGNCWWHTIVSPTGKEKTGYPTQKPIGVLKRIVAASSRPDDLVLDFFAGSGTTGAAALDLGRRFHLIDDNPEALAVMARRFSGIEGVEFVGYEPPG